MEIQIREFLFSDFPEVRSLWKSTPGFTMSSADTPDAIQRFLSHNPGCSFVAIAQGNIVGSILCGHDGRRGNIYHLLIAENYRRLGIGQSLVEHGLKAFRREGLDRCNLLVFQTNEKGIAFWKSVGAEERPVFAPFTIAL